MCVCFRKNEPWFRASDNNVTGIIEKSQQSGKVPHDWKWGDIVPIFKRGRKVDLVISSPMSFTSVPGRVMEQILLEAMLRHMEDREVIQDSKHSFTKWPWIMGFTPSVVRGMDIDKIYWDFWKAFCRVPHSILLSKVERDGFNGWTVQ